MDFKLVDFVKDLISSSGRYLFYLPHVTIPIITNRDI